MSLYEIAEIDGASSLRRFATITLPMISPAILFNVVMQSINAFQEFTGVFVITEGGPAKATYLYTLMIHDEAFIFFKIGYASALSWILLTIIGVVTFMVFWSSGRWVYYQDNVGA